MSQIEVARIFFDTEAGQPVLHLSDGTVRVVDLLPTGNCWVEYWVTPEAKNRARKANEKADEEWREQSIALRTPRKIKKFNRPW